MSNKNVVVVIGGGAAGFFGAIACAQSNPHLRVILIEKARQVLSKVKISGGGRCNVTHACFEPAVLVQNYPRGAKELRGPFTRFQPKDTIAWFESRGVSLKTESDGRMFPTTDHSETIVNCLMQQAKSSGVELRTECGVNNCERSEHGFILHLASGEILNCHQLLVATGSASKALAWLEKLGHSIEPQVPSLFTFNIPDSPFIPLAGTALPKVCLSIEGTGLQQVGPLLMTHWGFSGPAVLKLSAWGARLLHDKEYHAALHINWLPDFTEEMIKHCLFEFRKTSASRLIANDSPFQFSKNLWKVFLDMAGLSKEMKWAALSNQQAEAVVQHLTKGVFSINGKSTYKEEFVTCGGIRLQEVNFKTMESRLCQGLFFAGEVLDIDGVTGGFNFQNAWTTSWIAGKAIAESLT